MIESFSVLAQEILPHVAQDVPVFVAGGIATGDMIAAYLEMGAAGVQLGTAFVCSTECIAHPNFKKMFLRGSARDAIASVQIDPRLGRKLATPHPGMGSGIHLQRRFRQTVA